MKLSNTTEHARIGFIAGLLAGFVLPILHMEKLWLAFSIAGLVLMIGFEFWQMKVSTNPNYLKLKWLDCLLDILAGFIAFSIPVVILCLGLR